MNPSQNGPSDFRLGDWLVQPSLNRLSGSSGEVHLEPRAMRMLVLLAENAGAVVTRQQIIDAVWQQEFVGDAALSGTVAKLRRALGDDAQNPRYIETIHTRGYRLLPQRVDVLEVVTRPGGAFRVGEWLVEPSLNRMSRGDGTVQLEPSTMDVLLCLAERAGEPVPRKELVERVWRTESVSDFTVSRRVAELQEALGDSVQNPQYIEAAPDRGFRLAAAVVAAQPIATVTPFPRLHHEPERDPYPGLAAFTEADAALFFGREAETAAMWRRITSHRMLAVVGPSGVGKSSFLRAGVIPAAPPSWGTLVCTPGEAPFTGLARSLARELAGDAEQVEQLFQFDDPAVAVAVVSRWRERFDDALLVVDQLEELFTLNPSEIRVRFVNLLSRLATEARVHIVLVVRDDFLRECHVYPPMAPIFRDLTMLGPPAAHDLRRALVEPALRHGVRFDDEALPDEMVAAVAQERGALPLLAFAARGLWELRDRERRLLTREAYQRIGGVAGALAQHAEATLAAIGQERRPLVRELFRNLVTAQATRATRTVDELLSVFDARRREEAGLVLRALTDARLLTSFEEDGPGEGAGQGRRRVEIVHESLLREWPRLVRWQTQDADAARLRDQLRQAAQLWQERGRPAELLWTGAPYLEFRAWRASYPGGLTATESAFAEAMVGHAGRRRRRRRVVAAAVLLAAVVVAAVTSALWRRSEDRSLRLEERRLVETARATMIQSPPEAFAYALAALELKDSPEARRIAIEALWSSPMPLVIGRNQRPSAVSGTDFSPDGRWLAVGHFDGHLALWSRSGGPPVVWQPHRGRTRGYFTPDSKTLRSATSADSQLIMWSVPDLRRLGTQRAGWPTRTDIDARHGNIWRSLTRLVPDPAAPGGWGYDWRPPELCERLATDRLPAAALGPDGSALFYAVSDGLYLVSMEAPEAAPTLLGRCRSPVELIACHPDGEILATSHADGATRLWTTQGGAVALVREWPRVREGSFNDLRFDPAGTQLAAAFDDEAAVVRSLDEPPGADPLLLSPRGSRTVELAFHPDGRWLATAGMGRVCLWPLERARRPHVLRGHSGWVERLVFAPDGSWLASYGNDGTVRRWPLTTAGGVSMGILHDWGHPVERFVGWMDMSPDGRYVVTTGGGDTARLVWVNGSPPRTLGGFDQRVLRAAVGPQGRRVAVSGHLPGRQVVRIWDLETGAVAAVEFEEPRGDSMQSLLMEIQIGPDGRLLAAHGGRLLAVEPDTGQRETLVEGVGQFAINRVGTLALSRPKMDWSPCEAFVHDLVAGTGTPLNSHGRNLSTLALDASGTIAVTGSADGIVRVGPVSGEAPHWLVGHQGTVMALAVSPDGRLIASGGRDGTIRLWPMPDLTRPPLNALPHPELLARLRSLTNLRAVPDPEDPEGFVITTDPFPGWRTVPEW